MLSFDFDCLKRLDNQILVNLTFFVGLVSLDDLIDECLLLFAAHYDAFEGSDDPLVVNLELHVWLLAAHGWHADRLITSSRLHTDLGTRIVKLLRLVDYNVQNEL